ncbi:MAG: crotonase/enoyl-CoA hydratase family protein [Caulobacteraceae bacterium]|nr:crotonase/enoyl-CoA hydratase family protein [Caulobacteraceae bacterium]
MDLISYERDGPLAVVTIERPERRNAVDLATAQALYAAFQRFEAEEDAAIAILQGRGGHFCAGADLKAVAEGEGEGEGETGRRVAEDGEFGPMGPTRMRLSKPVIAAVEGYAVAGGLELACWCDLRVAAEGATFGVFCRRFGVPLVDLGTVRLPRLIGQSRAMDLILTGRPVDAREALDIGLANRMVADGQALEATRALGREIAAFPQGCLRNDRASALDQWSLDWEAATRREARLGLATMRSGETVLGAKRFFSGQGRHGSFQ